MAHFVIQGVYLFKTKTIYIYFPLILNNMLDIKFIRDNKDLVAAGAKKKHIEINLDELVSVDDERKKIMQSIETKRANQKVMGDNMAKMQSGQDKAAKLEELKAIKEEIQKEEETLKGIISKWQTLMIQVPNIPDISVPEGESDAQNVEVKNWGEPPVFDFKPKSHIELMEGLSMLDLERGTKIAGFRGYVLRGAGARLSFALWQYGWQFFLKKGFEPFIMPSLVKRELLLGSGYLPQGEEDLYKTQDGEYLAGTAEVPAMGFWSGEVLKKESLPMKHLAFSPCFRREAGSHGKDTKGVMRVHEFFKLEQVILCEASHEQSVRLHEEINRNTEELMESIGIPYRTVINCSGDLGLGQVKKYDIELWVPSEGKYREISSASYFHDFQTRRLNIRYRDGEEKLRFAHSLNCTALPTPRALIALIENNQRADGSIKIPEVLAPLFGEKEIRA